MAHSSHVGDVRRLLVISYHFPPDGSVGGLRWAGLSKYLARRGWEVHVVTASRQAAHAPVPGVTVHHRRRNDTLNDIYNRVASRLRSTPPSGARAQASASGDIAKADAAMVQPRAIGLLGRLRFNLSIALAFPDRGRGWILTAAFAARTLLRQHRFDAVVTSGPPHSAHLAGVLACLGRDEPRFVDMRDPFATGAEWTWQRDPLNPRGLRVLIPYLERAFFRRARGVITNTSELSDVLGTRFPHLDLTFIPNGIDGERLPAPSTRKFSGVSIAYAGTMYLGRDLTPVLRAMAALFAAIPEARRDVKLRVAGNMDGGHGVAFWREVDAGALRESVEFLGRLSNVDALDLMNRSHLNLVLAQQQPTQVPAKLYECVAMQIPTLVIAEATSAAAREARRIGAIPCEHTDVPAIRDLLLLLWRSPGGRVTPTAEIGYSSIAEQMERVIMEGARWQAEETR